MDNKDLKVEVITKIDDNLLGKIKNNAGCELKVKTTCIDKTKVLIEILEA
ncbi:hypothetical protein [Brassicibacter mesophilus]